MELEPEGDTGDVDPVLEPYARPEVPASHYVSAMAIFPGHRGEDLGTRMLEMAKEQAHRSGREQVSLLVFECNEGAVELYRRYGFGVIDRAPVVPHEAIRYAGEFLLMTATAE